MPCLTLEVKDTILSGLLELLTPGMACLRRMAPCPSHFKRFLQAGYRMTSEMKEAASIIRAIESTVKKGSPADPAYSLCSYCRGTTNFAGTFFHPERDHIGKCSAVLSTMKTFSSFSETLDSFTPQEDASFTVLT